MNFWKRIVLGFIVWLVPFAVSFLFYSPDGSLVIDLLFFKTIMVVVSGLTGTGLAVWYFKSVKTSFLQEGVWLGLTWLLVNWAADLLFVAVGFFELSIPQYFMEIGLRYLNAPIVTIGLGFSLQQLQKKHTQLEETGQ